MSGVNRDRWVVYPERMQAMMRMLLALTIPLAPALYPEGASAQFVDIATQEQVADTLVNVETYRHIKAKKEADAARAQAVALDALRPGFRRSLQTLGERAAKAWFRERAKAIDVELDAFAPEFSRRLQADGRDAAQRWLVGQAVTTGKRHDR